MVGARFQAGLDTDQAWSWRYNFPYLTQNTESSSLCDRLFGQYHDRPGRPEISAVRAYIPRIGQVAIKGTWY